MCSMSVDYIKDAPNTRYLVGVMKCLVGVMKEAPGISVSEELTKFFRNYDKDGCCEASDVRHFVRCSKQQMWLASKILNGYAYNKNPCYFASNVKIASFIDASFVVTPPCFGREGESVTADVLSTHDAFVLPLKPSQWRCIIHAYSDGLPLLSPIVHWKQWCPK